MSEISTATTPRREQTRAKLFEAAAQQFAETGMEAASVEAICERAGFTRGAFYSNFDSKEELFLQLAGRVATQRLGAVRTRIAELAAAGLLSGDVDLETAVPAVLDVVVDDPVGVGLMTEIRVQALRSPEIAAAFMAQEAAMLESIAALLDEIVEAHGLSLRIDATTAARIMLTTWEGEAARAAMGASLQRGVDGVAKRALGEVIALVIDLPREGA